MKRPIFVRSLSDDEREALQTALRSKDAFTLRRAQRLLASSRGERPPPDRQELGMHSSQTVRNAIHDFNRRGLDVLIAGSSRPKQTHAAFGAEGSREALQELLHRSPREFGRQSTWWTLEMAAEVSFEEGMTAKRITGQTARGTLERLGKSWQRAKGWIESPDREYARKKG